jgi:hypothetical protein
MKHKHAEIATRWLNDTSLVILSRLSCSKWKVDFTQNTPEWYANTEYFLVPECHIEVALAWLNGEEIERLCDSEFNAEDDYWNDYTPSIKHARFEEYYVYRIKPKTKQVKVWVGMPDNSLCPIVTLLKAPNESFKGAYTWTEVIVDQRM